MKVVFDQSSVNKMLDTLQKVPRRVANKHLRIALNAWGGVVRDAARHNVSHDTGLLDKSLAVKVTIPAASFNQAHHNRPARAMVGPDRRTVRATVIKGGQVKLLTDRKATARVLGGGKVRTRKPSRYAHLVEKKRPFIGPAQKVGGGQALEKLATKLRDGLEQSAHESK